MAAQATLRTFPDCLSAKYTGSFAYLTVKDRLPKILTKVIDTIHRYKNKFFEEHGEEGLEAEKKAISLLSKLKNELQTDKPILALTDGLVDMDMWNQYLERQQSLLDDNVPPSWFKSPWLYVECYMYRRIQEARCLNPPVSDFDVFEEGKTQSFFESQQASLILCTYLQGLHKDLTDLSEEQLREHFIKLLQVCLWGNRCDLSISAGQENSQKSSPIDSLESLKPFILVDESTKIWTTLLNNKLTRRPAGSSRRVDFVLDNAGFELITDLVLADFLVASGLATDIHFHGKYMPWFVSDTTKKDFEWTLRQMLSASHLWMSVCGARWQGYLKESIWSYQDHPFWTLPHEFCDMAADAPELYAELQRADLIVFKGDLNYRKLTGDRKWDYDVPFETALRGFHPAPLCSLRTLKADVQVGLQAGQGENLIAADTDWMTSGKYAIIQFCGPHRG